VEMSDVKHIINTGKIAGHELDIKTGDWKHTFSGQTLDGDLLNVVIALTDEGMDLITCWRDKK